MSVGALAGEQMAGSWHLGSFITSQPLQAAGAWDGRQEMPFREAVKKASAGQESVGATRSVTQSPSHIDGSASAGTQ